MKTEIKQLIVAAVTMIVLYSTYANASQTNTTQVVSTNKNAAIRDPFWPVSYTPIPETRKEEQKEIARLKSLVEWPKLKLKGITRGSNGRFIAVLDKIGIVEEGDIISVKKDGLIYRWQINSITAKGISRTRLNIKATFQSLHKQ